MTAIDRFNQHLSYVQLNSPYYRRVLLELGLAEFQLSNISDIKKLPLTSKDDLAAEPDSFLSAPMSAVRDIATTSGTLGDPVTVNVTESDLDRLAINEAGSFMIAGCDASDTFQLLTTIDKRFMAGLAYFLGARELGARMIRSGPGALELQWDSILRYKPTVLIAVPSFVPRLIAHAKTNGIDVNQTSVKKIIGIGEPLRNDDLTPNYLAKAITAKWSVQLFSTYASTEMATAFTECEHGSGSHIQSDLVHLEVLNDNDEHVENGELGEVVVTPLGVEGLALLRYRTGDICRVYNYPCKCGRSGPRLGPIIGRKQQMLKLKGTTLYPNAVIDFLTKSMKVGPFILEASSNELGLDELTVIADLREGLDMEQLSNELAEKLRVRPRIKIETANEINKKKFNENSRKPKIFFDLRHN
ncbi:MAG: phenylacetate-CoA ligase [Bacteroidia bacterium]|jgi:phenylacetate-CoA ligase